MFRLNRSEPHYTYPLLFDRIVDGFEALDASDHGLEERDGRGVTSLDYDNDGNIEVMTINYGQNVTVYDNVGTTGNSLQFAVEQGDRNRIALSVLITVRRPENSPSSSSSLAKAIFCRRNCWSTTSVSAMRRPLTSRLRSWIRTPRGLTCMSQHPRRNASPCEKMVA